MFKIKIRPEWLMARHGVAAVPLPTILDLLGEIEKTGHLVGACRACGLSYRHAWGLLREFETTFGVKLLITQRRQGTKLSPFAQKLLLANMRIQARLAPTLDSLASELEAELERSLPDRKPILRIHASHGFAVAALKERLAHSAVTLDLKYEGSKEALAALAKGSCEMAGFHVPLGPMREPVLDQYGKLVRLKQYQFAHLAVRTQGIVVAPGNPKNIRTLADFARGDVTIVNRQIGSGTRTLLDLLLAEARINPEKIKGYENSEFTHAAVAAYIASGMADAGFGVEPGARMFGLDFIPVMKEDYFFAFHSSALKLPAVNEVLALMRSDEFRGIVNHLPGYDGARCGEIVSGKDAFG